MNKGPNISINNVGSSCTLVTFGGIRNGIGMPQFEFVKSLGTLPVNRIFVKDTAQAWYQKGIPGKPSVEQLAEYLKEITKGTTTLTIGNSMGGFAALLFGTLINANHIIAFAPQTFISQKLRAKHNDTRWSKELSLLHNQKGPESRYYDLKSVLNSHSSNIEIVYGALDKLDTLHAARMESIKGIKVAAEPKGRHNAIVRYRDSGRLEQMVKEKLAI